MARPNQGKSSLIFESLFITFLRSLSGRSSAPGSFRDAGCWRSSDDSRNEAHETRRSLLSCVTLTPLWTADLDWRFGCPEVTEKQLCKFVLIIFQRHNMIEIIREILGPHDRARFQLTVSFDNDTFLSTIGKTVYWNFSCTVFFTQIGTNA